MALGTMPRLAFAPNRLCSLVPLYGSGETLADESEPGLLASADSVTEIAESLSCSCSSVSTPNESFPFNAFFRFFFVGGRWRPATLCFDR